MIKKFVYGILIALLLSVGVNRFLSLQSKSIDGFAATIVYPFLVIQHKLIHPLQVWWQQSSSYAELNRLLKKYIEYSENLQNQLIEAKSLVNYKEKTQELVDFAQRYKTDKAILTQILLKSFNNRASRIRESNEEQPLHFFLIDAGQNKGITPNMIAVYKNCLVGRVTHVYPYYSKVTLITDKLCKVAAYCATNGVQGIHEGACDAMIAHLTFVNHLDTVQEGDLVLSSGEGLIFPRGFGLGSIKKCEPDSLNHTIQVEPLLDFKTLEYCYILQKGAEIAPESKVEESSPTLPEPPKEIPLVS